MRFPTILFDLDGTVVDSGAIILASMRHATREVLGRDRSDSSRFVTAYEVVTVNLRRALASNQPTEASIVTPVLDILLLIVSSPVKVGTV